MKVIITMALSASFIVASTGITAEEGGIMKAIGKIDNHPKPLISVRNVRPSNHIRELHGDIRKSPRTLSVPAKQSLSLAKFKAKLRLQKGKRGRTQGRSHITKAY